jgi:hypothetical protein
MQAEILLETNFQVSLDNNYWISFEEIQTVII